MLHISWMTSLDCNYFGVLAWIQNKTDKSTPLPSRELLVLAHLKQTFYQQDNNICFKNCIKYWSKRHKFPPYFLPKKKVESNNKPPINKLGWDMEAPKKRKERRHQPALFCCGVSTVDKCRNWLLNALSRGGWLSTCFWSSTHTGQSFGEMTTLSGIFGII